MSITIYRMRFQRALRTGRKGIGLEGTDHRLSSDTLFAAIVSSLAQRTDGAVVTELISHFPRRDRSGAFIAGDSPFLLSSSFPFVGDTLLFPVPVNTSRSEGADPKTNKLLKKVEYVSTAGLKRLVTGESLATLEEYAHKLQSGKVWIIGEQDLSDAVELTGRIWETNRRPRVAVDRNTNRSAIFHHGESVFNEGCGLWFAIDWRRMDTLIQGYNIRTLVESALQDLTYHGIGALRSKGLGAFDLEYHDNQTVPQYADGQMQISLSRFHPAPDDVIRLLQPNGRIAYRFEHIGGYMQTNSGQNRPRKVVTMLKEGSVLSAGMIGCLVDASPEDAPHPSWRYGIAFPALMSDGAA